MTGKLEETNSPYAMAKLASIEIANSLKKEFGHQVINHSCQQIYMDQKIILVKTKVTLYLD